MQNMPKMTVTNSLSLAKLLITL